MRSALTTRVPSRWTNGSNRRSASSIVMSPSRTTCGTLDPVTRPARPRAGLSGELGPDELQHFLGVLPHLDLGKDAADGAGGIDDEGRPVDAEELAAEKAPLAVDPVGGGDRGARIAQEEEGQPVFGGEVLVRLRGVAAHTEDDRVVRLVGPVGVAEAAGFHGASRRRILGIEVEDEVLLADKILQAHLLAPGTDEIEIGGLRADLR